MLAQNIYCPMTAYTDPGEQAVTRRRKVAPRSDRPSNLWDAQAPSVPRPTSEDAADGQSRTKRNTDRARILRTVAWHEYGLTRDEIADELTISPNTVRPRIVELVTLGLVHDTRLTRLTQTGSRAAVCEATDAGRRWLDTEGTHTTTAPHTTQPEQETPR